MKNLKFSKAKTVAKGEILLKHGEITKYGYFVKSGCLKSYTIDKAGKEHIIQFAPEDWMISDLDSYTNQTPTVLFIEAIEESEVLVISRSDFKDFEDMDREFVNQTAIKFRNNLIASNKRIIALLSASSKERYIDFIETYPTLVNRLPLKLIASYIGVTPEYLSEIRRKIVTK